MINNRLLEANIKLVDKNKELAEKLEEQSEELQLLIDKYSILKIRIDKAIGYVTDCINNHDDIFNDELLEILKGE